MAGSDQNKGLLPSELAERFRVERPIKRGGTGSLFLAIEENTGIPGVLKLLRSRFFRGTPDKQRFRREISRQATVDHPHLVTPSVSGEVENSIWFFRDYVEGVSLRERIDAGGSLPAQESFAIMAQLATALFELHSNGLVHRDLKPGHVMLQDDGSGMPRVLLLDASVAAPIEFESVFDVNGTPSYVSPEQVQGRLISFRSDLYALGCIFYEMLTGHRAFEGEDTDDTMTAHVHRPAPTPPEGIPPEAAELLSQLLEKRPRQRPGSAMEVFERLSPLLHDAAKASVLVSPESSPKSARSGRPPPPPSGEFQAMSDLATASTVVTNPPVPGPDVIPPTHAPSPREDAEAESAEAPEFADESPAEPEVTPSSELDSDLRDVVETPPPPGGEPLLGEATQVESNEPGPTTAAEAMSLDFDRLAESLGDVGRVEKDHEGEDLMVLDGSSTDPESVAPVDAESVAPAEPESAPPGAQEMSAKPEPVTPEADAAPPAEDLGDEPGTAAAAEGAPARAPDGNEGVNAPDRTTWVLMGAVGLALLVFTNMMSVELFGDTPDDLSDASPDALVVYLLPEGGWYWRPDAAPELDGSIFAAEELDLLAPLYPLDIDAGLSSPAQEAIVVQVRTDSGEPVDGGLADAAGDGGAADGAVDAAAEGGPDAGDGGLSGDSGAAADATVAPGPPDAEPPAPLSWDERRERARDLFARGDYPGARDEYLSLVRERRDFAGAWAGLGASYTRLESWEQAIPAYQQAIRNNPNKSGYYASLGNAFRQVNDRARARQAYERALRLNPRNTVALRALRELGVVFEP